MSATEGGGMLLPRMDPEAGGLEVEAAWKALLPRTELFLPAAREICLRHGLEASGLERLPGGSTPVFAVGPTRVLKLYGPAYASEFDHELAALHALARALTVETPEVVAHGHVEGWPYLVMTRLEGRPFAEVRNDLPRADRERLVEEMGRALASLHAIPADRAPGVLRTDWPTFLEDRRREAFSQQQRRGLGAPWLDSIPAFLEAGDAVPVAASPVLLHTEPSDSAWLVRQGTVDGSLSGLIDFADAMTGDREYDFLAVGIFVTRGDRALFRRFLVAYGYPPTAIDRSLTLRLMRLTLLHKYAHLPWFLSYSGASPTESTFPALAEHWFGA